MDTDTELLRRFASTGDQTAFAALVSRHAGMVRGVAWRRTQDWTAAEEIAQNVFAILARKASGLPHEVLAGWLHRAAVLESANAARKVARYREALRHLRTHMTDQPSTGDAAWEELRPHLDEALTRLPAEARHLVVLRYLEHRPLADIAAATGKNQEACRKRLQRSLRLLESLLRRRGVSHTGTSLAAVLAAQNLCSPPANAAALAAAALHAAPTLTAAQLTTPLLQFMNAGTIAKTAVITLTLAAIPLALLWRQNSGLQATARRLEDQAAARASAPAPPLLQPRATPAPEATASIVGGKVATAPAAVSAEMTPEQTAQARLKRAREKVRSLVETEFTRLCLNLPDLTADQKTRIKEALDRKGVADLQDMLQAFQSGAVASAVQNPQNLTPEEKTSLTRMARLDPRKTTPPVIDEELKAILTPGQYATHASVQEARRVSEAEESAGDTLKFISRSFDLTTEQKDRIFQQLAQHTLSPDQPTPTATGEDPFPEIGSREEARDRIIRANLTPQQAEVFDQKRAAEREILRQQMMEFYAKPKAAAPPE